MIGTLLGHYRIVEKIGEGGMGVVYKARDTHLDRLVAIKVLPADKVADPERKRRFVQEAKAASALNHPNIVTIYDIDQANGIDFIAMEYVDGRTLSQCAGRKGMKLGECLKVAIQIADALSAAHAAGIVHRDLKPANVLVTNAGQAKVLDFGLAKLMQTETELVDETATLPPTEEGRVIGTAAYMSPEQAEGKAVDARSDIFSFGSVLYEMATGRRAFEGDGGLSILSAILNREPAPMSAEIPAEFEKIVQRCMRKDPARRFQHIGDVKIELEDLKTESDSGTLGRPVAAHQPARRKFGLWIGVAALLVLVAGSLLLYFQRTPAEPEALTVVPLTNYQGEQAQPTFSPDGGRVAFTWNGEKQDNFDIYIKPIGPGPARRLTTDPAPDARPAWSPDGSWIAFERSGSVYLISPEGGPERRLAEGHTPSWAPDGRSLVVQWPVSREQPQGVYLVSVETGERTGPLISPLAKSMGDSRPVFSPDGRNLAFCRRSGLSTFVNDIYVLPLAKGKPSGDAWRLTNDGREADGLTWTTDSREIIFTSNRSGRRSLWRIVASPGANPQRVPGTDDAGWSTISPGTPSRLVYARVFLNDNIWHMRVPGTGEVAGTPEPVVASTGRESDPQFSPDGGRIAFRSDRSGFLEIMACGSDGANPVQLTHFKGTRHAGAPRWSPDSRRIAFDSQGPDGIRIYVIGAQGGAARPLPGGDWSDVRPSWSMDGRWVYFGSNRSGTNQIWKASPTWESPQQVTQNGGLEAFESPDGKTLFYTKGGYNTPGLWSAPAEGGKEAALPQLSSVRPGAWAVADLGIYFADLTDAPAAESVPVRFYDFQTQQLSQVCKAEQIIYLLNVCFTVTRDGRWIAWKRRDRAESNLMLIENFH